MFIDTPGIIQDSRQRNAYSSDITTPAPTVTPSFRKMTLPMLRLTWKGSTGIPRLLKSSIRTMAAPPIGMCLASHS